MVFKRWVMSVTDEIKDRLDIVDIVSESVELRHSGKNYTGFCPFHHNVNTPAFVVFPDTQTWHCFGECDEGGDLFSFVMKREGWEFQEVLRQLADRAGVQLKPLTPEQQEEKEEHQRLRTLLEEAVTYYRHQLTGTGGGERALEYLTRRGINRETMEQFGLGYAPDSWEATGEYFRTKGYTEEELLEVGLASSRDSGGIYDRFRNRLMIPIRDRRERMAGFGARVLDPDDVPKYLNSPQTVLFDKSRLLYGLDRARRAIRDQEEVVIVEGYLGVIVPFQHGFQNVVATMGTALTDEHLRKVKRYTNRIILALDSDAAGVKATLRGLDVARETLDRKQEVDARAWIRREARLQADLRVAVLPEGQDPDDVVNQDPDRLREILDQARPVVIHVMETLAEGRDLDDPKVKSEIAAQVVPLIEDIPSEIEREAYSQRLARRLELDEITLLSYRSEKRGSRPSRIRSRRPAPPEPPREKSSGRKQNLRKGDSYEGHCVGILLREPELLYRIDRQLTKAGLKRLTEGDFQNADHQILIGLIRGALQQNDQEPRTFVVEKLSGEILSKADELLEQTSDLDPKADKVLEDLLRAFLNLRKWQVSNSNSHLRYLLENDQADGDFEAGEYQTLIIENLRVLNRIDKAIKLFTSRTAALR